MPGDSAGGYTTHSAFNHAEDREERMKYSPVVSIAPPLRAGSRGVLTGCTLLHRQKRTKRLSRNASAGWDGGMGSIALFRERRDTRG